MRVAVLVNADKPHALDLAHELVAWLAARGHATVTTRDLAHHLPGVPSGEPSAWGPTDMAIVLGGDGTLLQAARQLAPLGVPLLGVNLGHLGFLTEFEGEELFDRLPGYLAGAYEVDERSLLSVRVARAGGDAPEVPERLAFNDAVISRVPFSRLLRIEVEADGDAVATYLADGIIVATPTGSTAYSLAAGGPVLDPSLAALVVTPICAYSFGSRPIVVPAGRRVRARVAGPERDVVLTLDGQQSLPLATGDAVDVAVARPRVRLLRTPGWNFYGVLHRKMAEGTPE